MKPPKGYLRREMQRYLSSVPDAEKNEIAALERTGDFAKAKKNCQSYIEEYPYDQEMQDEYLFLKTRMKFSVLS